MGVEREASRDALRQVTVAHVDLAQLATRVGTPDLFLDALGRGFADQATVMAAHVRGDRLIKTVTAYANRF